MEIIRREDGKKECVEEVKEEQIMKGMEKTCEGSISMEVERREKVKRVDICTT